MRKSFALVVILMGILISQVVCSKPPAGRKTKSETSPGKAAIDDSKKKMEEPGTESGDNNTDAVPKRQDPPTEPNKSSKPNSSKTTPDKPSNKPPSTTSTEPKKATKPKKSTRPNKSATNIPKKASNEPAPIPPTVPKEPTKPEESSISTPVQPNDEPASPKPIPTEPKDPVKPQITPSNTLNRPSNEPSPSTPAPTGPKDPENPIKAFPNTLNKPSNEPFPSTQISADAKDPENSIKASPNTLNQPTNKPSPSTPTPTEPMDLAQPQIFHLNPPTQPNNEPSPSTPAPNTEDSPWILETFDKTEVDRLQSRGKCWEDHGFYHVCMFKGRSVWVDWKNYKDEIEVEMDILQNGDVDQKWSFDDRKVKIVIRKPASPAPQTQIWTFPKSSLWIKLDADGKITNKKWRGPENTQSLEKYRGFIDAWCAHNDFFVGKENCIIY